VKAGRGEKERRSEEQRKKTTEREKAKRTSNEKEEKRKGKNEQRQTAGETDGADHGRPENPRRAAAEAAVA
jgi:hypothetical protein